jgi:hypothetical protein
MKDVIPITCPMCQGWSWHKIDTRQGGYSFGKGVVGAAVFGPVGAVAGINGRKTVTYKCDKCGYTGEYKQ